MLSEKGGEKKHRNLMLLYDFARRYEESSYKGLNAFLKYLDETENLEEANNNLMKIVSEELKKENIKK